MHDLDRAIRTEAAAMTDAFAAAPPDLAAATRTAHARLGPFLVLANHAMPHWLFNRALPASAAAPSDDEIAQAQDWLEAHAEPSRALQLPEGDDRPRRLGLEPTTAIMRFLRPTSDLPAAPTDLAIVEAGPELAPAVAALLCEVFEIPSVLEPWFAALVGRPGWTVLAALDGGRPVATGAVCVTDDGAWIGNGACRPEHRRRGAQSALLAARLAAAARAGATLATVETGSPADGDLSKNPSYRNILRAGFEPAQRRVNWRRPG